MSLGGVYGDRWDQDTSYGSSNIWLKKTTAITFDAPSAPSNNEKSHTRYKSSIHSDFTFRFVFDEDDGPAIFLVDKFQSTQNNKQNKI